MRSRCSPEAPHVFARLGKVAKACLKKAFAYFNSCLADAASNGTAVMTEEASAKILHVLQLLVERKGSS